MAHTKNFHNTWVTKHILTDRVEPTQDTNQGPDILENVETLKSQTVGHHHILTDRARPIQGTVQGPTQIQTQIEEPIGGPDSAHSRYQSTT